MMNVFDCSAVLFESTEEDEALRIECAMTPSGSLEIAQESDGPLTEWCFEESPHRIEATVAPEGVRELLTYFHVDDVWQLLAVLRLEFTGFDCFQRLRTLMRHLDIGYTVTEAPVVR